MVLHEQANPEAPYYRHRGLLCVQYWLGIGINLFITVPGDAPLAFLSYTGGLEVLAHIADGSLIFIIGLAIIWISTRQGKRLLPKLSLLALVLVALAVVKGLFVTLRG